MISSVTIVTVNYNAGAHLARCLDSVAAYAADARVVVVDNASRDDSLRAAEARPGVTVVRNAQNRGFGAAVNQAVALPGDRTPLVLLLNPDCELLEGAARRLQEELAAHPACAVAGPAVFDEDGELQGSVRGDPTMMTGLFGRTTLLTRLFPTAAVARRNVAVGREEAGDASREADWVSGACMLLRRDAFEEVGGFDERYFLYWEDADLCRRLRARGYTTRYVPAARVVHAGGGSSRSARALAIRAFHRSAFTYYATHVARGPVSRSLAWLLLAGRCRLKLLASRLRPLDHAVTGADR
jgi:GT2 family glycosyltransferase